MLAIFKASYDTGLSDSETMEPLIADYQFSFETINDDAGAWGIALVKALTHGSEYSMDLVNLEVIAL